MKRHYYKGKERNHSPIGCEHENLRPDLFPLREAMLETLFLRSYILSHMLQDKTIFFSRTPLLQTLALTDAKASPNPPLRRPPPPPVGVFNNESLLYTPIWISTRRRNDRPYLKL